MHEPLLLTALLLALLIAALSVAVRQLRIASPILMLVAGAAIAFLPGIPSVPIDPNLVLLGLLPPVLYSSGVGMSWRGFKSNLRPILLLAIGCVLFTMLAVAGVVHYALGVPWAIGFVLGAIVAPPDAVAPIAVLSRVVLPKRLFIVLEGESLVNDATALVAFSFALTAAVTGTFSPSAAALRFGEIVVGEIAFGIVVGWAMLHLRRLATDPRAEVLLALSTPFLTFWPPHAVGGSGVVACVTAGLYVSWNGRRLIRPQTRLQGYFIWDLVNWGSEALVFLLTGLQAHSVVANLPGVELRRALLAGALVTATVVVVRFVWVYPATYLPRIIPAVRRRNPYPNWRLPFLVAFAGLRGVVSLVAALTIPAMLGGQPFPERGLVLFATFFTIATTLIGLGLLLPAVVRVLGLHGLGARESEADKRQEQNVRLEGVRAVLDALRREETEGAPAGALAAARRQIEDRHEQLSVTVDDGTEEEPVADAVALELRLLQVERAVISEAYVADRLTDDARRRIEREFDLEEARLLHALESTTRHGLPE